MIKTHEKSFHSDWPAPGVFLLLLSAAIVVFVVCDREPDVKMDPDTNYLARTNIGEQT